MQSLKAHKKSILAFFLCALLVFLIQFTLHQPVIQYRLFNTTEDWQFIVFFRSLDYNPLLKIIDLWTRYAGLHTTSEIYHTGILASIAGTNYQAFHIINLDLKVLSILTVFPLVLVLFKNRLLAFLSTVLYAIVPAPSGSFLWIGKGSVYLAVTSLNIFLISYYYAILNNSKKLLIFSSFLFLITYLLSPSRMFPALLLVLLVEIFWLIKSHKISNIKHSALRLLLFYLPVILISIPAPVSNCCPFTKRPLMIIKEMIDGNWHNSLYPLAGIGYSLFSNEYWKFFGQINLYTFSNLGTYLDFILSGSFWIFLTLTLFFSLLLSKKPWKFILKIVGLNFMLEILVFYIAKHNFDTDPYLFLISKYPTLIAIYIFIIVIFTFFGWRKDQKNNLLLALWAGPIFSAVFVWPTWLVMNHLMIFPGSINWYLVISPIGMSVFLGGVFVLCYQKSIQRKIFKRLTIILIIAILLFMYKLSSIEIYKGFIYWNPEKVKLSDQQLLHARIINHLKPANKTGNILFFFDIYNSIGPDYYKRALVSDQFGDWVHFRRGKESYGCVAAIFDKDTLKKSVKIKNGIGGFIHKSLCIDKEGTYQDYAKKYHSQDDVFYDIDSFYAFKLDKKDLIDIKDQVLKDLNLSAFVSPNL